MKNHFQIERLPTQFDLHQATPKPHVDDKFNGLSIKKNTGHVHFKYHKLDNVRFVKVNSYPGVAEHLCAKYYVNEAVSNSIDESSLLGIDLDEEIKLDEQVSMLLNSSLTSQNKNRITYQRIC